MQKMQFRISLLRGDALGKLSEVAIILCRASIRHALFQRAKDSPA